MTEKKKDRIWMMIYSFAFAALLAGMFMLVLPDVNKLFIIAPILSVYGYVFYSTFFKKKNKEKSVPGEPK